MNIYYNIDFFNLNWNQLLIVLLIYIDVMPWDTNMCVMGQTVPESGAGPN